jgi:hypothetical protein
MTSQRIEKYSAQIAMGHALFPNVGLLGYPIGLTHRNTFNEMRTRAQINRINESTKCRGTEKIRIAR